jgi:hypothetical protein
MGAQARSTTLDANEPFTTRSLWRLASWGAGASLALGLAVAAGYSESGSRRLLVALHSPAPPKGDSATGREVPRTTEANAALAETVRLLVAERDRLGARVARLETHVEDLTGSITASERTAQPGASALRIEQGSAQNPEHVQSGAARPAETPVERREEPRSGALESSSQVPTSNETAKGEYGADIGSAPSFEGLRTLWSSMKTNNPDLFENLYPLVSVQENSRTRAPQLRLIVGPFFDAEGASRFCAAIASARLICQPTGFDGQRLADADRPVERKPAAPRAGSRPSQAAPPRLFGLF